MEEEWTTNCEPLFGETSSTYYKVKGTDHTIISKTRSVTNVKSVECAANELFADDLWPGCFVLADILCKHSVLCQDKYILELGAGSALPGTVASVLGAKKVVLTDYPEPTVIENIEYIVKLNNLNNIMVLSHAWGSTVEPLLNCLGCSCTTTGNTADIVISSNNSSSGAGMDATENLPSPVKFDLILCAELLWKDTYSQHNNLLKTLSQCINPTTGIAMLTFVHRPTITHTIENDLEFFKTASSTYGLKVSCLGTNSTYKDALDSSGDYAEVFVYLLYYNADISDITI